ncbi:MAG: type VI secretion system-associated protein TagF [Blastopirellula sp.]|nr:MAG: type VI secretion system-associated protein TagF [Blastopirellula sp.]
MTEGFGAFGKIPAAGDFFRLNPPTGFVQVWDDWIQRAMLGSQAAMGPDWDAAYMSAPIWRFSLSAGLAGPQKVMGVLMPSVDRVGRRFPLTLMAALPTPGPAQLDHFSEEVLFARLEDVALDALEDTMTRDGLEARLETVQPPQFRSSAPIRAVGSTLVLTQPDSRGLLPELAAGLLASHVRVPSIWSAVINDVPRMMVCDGLPEGPVTRGLFDLNAPIWSEAKPI